MASSIVRTTLLYTNTAALGFLSLALRLLFISSGPVGNLITKRSLVNS